MPVFTIQAVISCVYGLILKIMSNKCKPATKKELEWIEDFKKLAKRCPKKLWLFSASGSLHVMKTPDNGEENGGGSDGFGVDSSNSIDTITISNDGGDW